jgi:DNA-binding MarR family transcriptional regulator
MEDADCAKLLLEVIPNSMRSIRFEMRSSAKHQVTIPQFRILVRLSKSTTSNAKLADDIGVSPPTMSRMIDPLVRKKMVKRVADYNDRRQVNLSLTEKGSEIFHDIQAAVRARLSERLSKMPFEEKTKLTHGLQSLKEFFSNGGQAE